MKRTTTFTLGLAVAAAMLAAPDVQADPNIFSVRSHTMSTDGVREEDFTISNYMFGTTDWIDSLPDNGAAGTFNIEVNSGPSQRPDFEYDLVLNYADYDIGFFLNGSGPGTHEISLIDLKTDFSITDVFVKDSSGSAIGDWSTDGNSIVWNISVQDLLAAIGGNRDLPITIQWSQGGEVPGPGALALLGVAGLVSRRRRR